MSRLRLGSIQFINSLPVDWGMLSGVVEVPAQMITGTPAQLNQQMLDSHLDVSPVSAIFYAEHMEDLYLLPDLSISSQSGVQSVLLFSHVPLRELACHGITVTSQGRTTPILLEILCREKYGFIPQWRTQHAGAAATLLIGDEALLMRERNIPNMFITDLAQEWQQWTGAPFVFAVWAARREAMEKFPAQVQAVHQAILNSKCWGLSHLEQILSEAERKTALSREVLRSYFSCLFYGLSDELHRGMGLYFDYAAKCGLLKNVVRITS